MAQNSGDVQDTFRTILAVFKDMGYPPALIQQWTLPEGDVVTLLRKVEEVDPRRVLEVGTYVGLTALTIALHTHDDCRIDTVDPNFPLSIEMLAMHCASHQSNTDVRTQELGREAARRLGVEHKIRFHAGGFSTSETFASMLADPNSRTPVVGPDVCARHGPFDFVFVDGLHNEEAVFSDLSLACDHLAPDGTIALHDITGRWSSNVRRAVYRFLMENENFRFHHLPFAKLYEAMGFLKHRAASQEAPVNHGWPEGGLVQKSNAPEFSIIMVNLVRPKSVIQFGYYDGILLEHLKRLGVEDIHVVTTTRHATSGGCCNIQTFDFLGRFQPAHRYDLCICLGEPERIEPGCADNLLQACVDSSDTIVFGATPPGELGLLHQNEHPVSYWVKKFLEKGYVFHDKVRPLMEPFTYANMRAKYLFTSPFLLNTYLVKKEHSLGTNPGKSDDLVFSELIEKEKRNEDLSVQRFYYEQALSQLLNSADPDGARQIEELKNSFNKEAGEKQALSGKVAACEQQWREAIVELEQLRQIYEKQKSERASLDAELAGMKGSESFQLAESLRSHRKVTAVSKFFLSVAKKGRSLLQRVF